MVGCENHGDCDTETCCIPATCGDPEATGYSDRYNCKSDWKYSKYFDDSVCEDIGCSNDECCFQENGEGWDSYTEAEKAAIIAGSVLAAAATVGVGYWIVKAFFEIDFGMYLKTGGSTTAGMQRREVKSKLMAASRF